MYKETITYTDYNDVERTEDFYFNLTKAELTELQASYPGGLAARMSAIAAAKDMPAMMRFIKKIILKSYGEKSEDGRRLVKGDNQEIAKAFCETPAYDILFQKIFTEDGAMVRFFTGIMPSDIAEKIRPNLNEYFEKGKLPAGV